MRPVLSSPRPPFAVGVSDHKMARHTNIGCVVLICLCPVLAALSRESSTFGRDRCNLTTSNYEDLLDTFLAHNFTLRLSVDAVEGNDSAVCLNGSQPCRTLNYALCQGADGCPNRGDTVVSFRNLEVYLAPGRHRLTSRVRFQNSSYIHIYGDAHQETALLCAEDFPNDQFPCVFDNLAFFRSNHIWLSGITVTHCGPVAVGVFMGRVSDVIVQNCTFTQNAAPGMSILNRTNRVYLVDNVIYNNTGLSLPSNLSDRSCSGVARVSSFQFRAGASGGYEIRAHRGSEEMLVLRNKFIDNTAVPDFNDSTIPASRRPFGRGGAMTIGLIGSIEYHMCIKDSVVRGNHARLAAGGVSFYLISGAKNNSITIENSVVEDNSCGSEECFGGGVHFTFEDGIIDTTTNSMYVYDTMFVNNSAGTGGGFLGVLYSSESGYVFSNCTFIGNKARYDGSALVALSMASIIRGGNHLRCFSCHFESNVAFSLEESHTDVAAVRLYRVRLTLSGTTFFYNNSGGGLDITQGQVDVVAMVTFEGNTAILGAAMRLFGQTEVFLAPGSNLTFVGNRADRLGGAIYVQSALNQIEPRHRLNACFLQSGITPFMDTPPQKWNVTVSFHGNSAEVGGSAIYATDFEHCCWLGQENIIPPCSSSLVFVPHPGYQPPFKYWDSKGSAITEKDDIIKLLGTDPQYISVKPQARRVSYGETVQTTVSLADAFNHSRSAVFSTEAKKLELVQQLGSSAHNYDDTYVFSAEGPAVSSELRDKCNDNSRTTSSGEVCSEKVQDSVKFSIFPGERKSAENTAGLTLDIFQCHPGYAFNPSSSSCMCRSGENYVYRQFICETNGRYLYVPDGIAVEVTDDMELNTVFVPLSYLKCNRSREISSLPVCEFRFDGDFTGQCAEGRTGTLCGTCKSDEGFCLSMDLQYCLKQGYPWIGSILYLAICVLAVLGCIVILYFNIGVPNELRGFFFYAQVIGLVYRYNYRLFSEEDSPGFFAVNFLLNLLGTNLPFPLCISPWIQATWMAFLGYIPPLLALTTVGIFVLSARCVRRLANRSTLSGITLILLLFYKYLTDSSFFFINCVRIRDGNIVVSRFSGQPCFSAPHVVLFVFSIIIILGIVVPLPFFFLAITCKHFRRMMHLSDALSKGMRTPCRWYAAWDILRRVLFVITVLIPGLIIAHRLLVLCLLETIVLVVHCLSKPYEKKWINIVEALILLDLFVATAAILQQQDPYVTRWLVGVVMALPFLYAVALGTYLVGKYLWNHCLAAKWRERLTVFLSPSNWKSPSPNKSGANEGDYSSFYVSHSSSDSHELPWSPRVDHRLFWSTDNDNWDRQALFQESLLIHEDDD